MRKEIITFLIILITFQSYFYNIFPVQLFGISIFLILFLVSIFIIFICDYRKQGVNNIVYYSIFIIFYFIFSYFRDSYYNYGNLTRSLIMGFSWYLVPMFIMLTRELKEKWFDSFYYILYVILIIQSILSVFFILGLPTINLLTENHQLGYLRYVGVMGGANVNANFNALIVSILILGPSRFKISKKVLIIVLGIISIIPSLSRLSLVIIFFLIAYLIRISFIKNIYNKLVIIILLFISSCLLIYNPEKFNEIGTINKIVSTIESGSDQVRSEKYSYGISILFNDINSILIGPASELQMGRHIEFSDNSYIQMALYLGVPMFILYSIFLIYLIKQHKYNKTIELNIYTIIFLITCFLNNSILWIPWLFLFFIGFRIISYNKKYAQN